MTPALLWKPLKDGLVKCLLCSHFCRIEPEGKGKCGVRVNKGGKLFSLSADRVAALNLDPVEKKPLYHFHPGSFTYSIGTMGCNLSCLFCQNHDLSQPPKLGRPVAGRKTSPEELAAEALAVKAASLAYTYSEPTIFFELVLETAKLAKSKGMDNIMVSNGFMSRKCLDELGPHIQAANIDLKSFSDDFYRDITGSRLKPVLANLKHIKALGWHLEVTTLLIPGLNDSSSELEDSAGFIHDELGSEVPWHISRFHPSYRLLDRPVTPVESLERAVQIGKRAGLKFVYIGNVPGHAEDNTYCPSCGKMVVQRMGFQILAADPGKCLGCQTPIPGAGMNDLAAFPPVGGSRA